MSDKIEKNNVEIDAGWWAKEKTDYSKILWWKKEQLWAKETAEERKQADEELLTKIESTEAKKDTLVKNAENKPDTAKKMPTGIHEAIHDLNRPEAEKGIAQAYSNIDTTIKNSKNEKWIAGFLGRIMNKIMG